MSEPAEQTLRTIKGYELRAQIGEGGFGEVYRAFQPVIERDVAIKVILPQYANEPDFIRNFELEARLVARLEHPHIVPLFDFWRDPQGAYIVMRYIRGGSLRTYLDDANGPLDLEIISGMLNQITSALYTAHRNQVVHRDMKPENILIDEDGNAYVTDFGIAKRTEGTDISPESEDQISGSPFYMSPEQFQAAPPHPSTDVYSLGIMLYEMMTGKHPFNTANLGQLVMSHMQDMLPSVLGARPGVSEEFDEILHQATAKAPEDRYDDIRDLARDFATVLGNTLGDEQALATPMTVDWEITNPYKGLRAFDEADSDDFFGREDLVGQLLDELQETTFLAVVGPSGSGKSSVVRAGVIPRLRAFGLEKDDGWYMATCVPGRQPVQSLAAALLSIAPIRGRALEDALREDEGGLTRVVEMLLSDPNDRLLVFIDQFEELFTLVEDEIAREHFLNLLLHAAEHAPRLRVIITLRADFYDRPLYYDAFGNLMRANTQVVLPMSPAEIERAVTGPAERVGLEVSTELVASIVGDVRQEPGALPLLQYALTEVFERRDGMELPLDAYEAIGGITGALARRADEVYASLTPSQQAAARQVFLRLVTLGEGKEDTRRRVNQAELVAMISERHLLDDVLSAFGRYRLLTFDTDPETREPVVEVAHEAIIREWTLLRRWLDDSRNDIYLQRTLSGLVDAWEDGNRDESYLLRGARLAQFSEWATNTELALSQTEHDFVAASEAARRARTRRARRLQLGAAGIGLAVLIILSLLTAFAFRQSRTAQTEAASRATAQANSQLARETSDANAVFAATAAAEAQVSAERAVALLLASEAQQALRIGNTTRALSFALASYQLGAAQTEARRTLATAAYAPGAARQYALHEGEIRSLAFTPGGERVITTGADAAVLLVDVNTGEVLQTFEGHFSPVNTAVFNDSGTQLVTADEGGVVILWDFANGVPMQRFEGHTRSVTDVDFGPFDASIVSSSDDGSVILWDTFDGSVVRRFEEHEGTVWTVDFSEDGSNIISGGADARLYLWSAASGEVLETFQGHTGPVLSASFSPDATRVVSGAEDNTVILWDVFSGEQEQLFAGHTGPVRSVAFDPPGRRVLSGAADGLVIMWDISREEEIQRYQGHLAGVTSIAFRPNSSQLASVSSDQSLILWDTQPGSQLRNFQKDSSNLWAMAYAPDGATALTSSDFHRLILFDTDDTNGRERNRFLDGHTDIVWSIAYSADATRAVSGSDNGDIILWDLETTEMIRQFDAHDTGGVWAVAYSPVGDTVLTGSDDRALILWDAETGEEIRRFDGYNARVRSVAFSPDGTMALAGSDAAELKLWDIETGEMRREYIGHVASVRSVTFSADGEHILSGSDDTVAIYWDTFSGVDRYRLDAHSNWVTSVALHPTDPVAVTASEDNSVILWDLEDGSIRWSYEAFGGGVWRVAFGPAGNRILTASGSGMGRSDDADLLLMWRVDTLPELLAWIRENRVVQPIACTEQAALGLSSPECTPDSRFVE